MWWSRGGALIKQHEDGVDVMFKVCLAVGLACAMVLPAAAQVTNSGKNQVKMVQYSSPMMPPANYKGQWWTSPDNCQYSRAGREGETVWYLIVNTAHMQCERRLIQRAMSDYQ
jgi:hypothetical protein